MIKVTKEYIETLIKETQAQIKNDSENKLFLDIKVSAYNDILSFIKGQEQAREQDELEENELILKR